MFSITVDKSDLEIAVLVDFSSSEPRHLWDAGNVDVCVGKQEQIHGAAGGNTLLTQLCVEVVLWTENCLHTNRHSHHSAIAIITTGSIINIAVHVPYIVR